MDSQDLQIINRLQLNLNLIKEYHMIEKIPIILQIETEIDELRYSSNPFPIIRSIFQTINNLNVNRDIVKSTYYKEFIDDVSFLHRKYAKIK